MRNRRLNNVLAYALLGLIALGHVHCACAQPTPVMVGVAAQEHDPSSHEDDCDGRDTDCKVIPRSPLATTLGNSNSIPFATAPLLPRTPHAERLTTAPTDESLPPSDVRSPPLPRRAPPF
jgi:hypothetical protein